MEASYIVTFRENGGDSGRELLRNQLGIRDYIHSNDWRSCAMKMDSSGDPAVAHVFDNLNICCIRCADDDACKLHSHIPSSALLAIEQDHEIFAMESETVGSPLSPDYVDTSNTAWGLAATSTPGSQHAGRGVRIAVLDTGIAREHPDFSTTDFKQFQSFVAGNDAEGQQRPWHALCGNHSRSAATAACA